MPSTPQPGSSSGSSGLDTAIPAGPAFYLPPQESPDSPRKEESMGGQQAVVILGGILREIEESEGMEPVKGALLRGAELRLSYGFVLKMLPLGGNEQKPMVPTFVIAPDTHPGGETEMPLCVQASQSEQGPVYLFRLPGFGFILDPQTGSVNKKTVKPYGESGYGVVQDGEVALLAPWVNTGDDRPRLEMPPYYTVASVMARAFETATSFPSSPNSPDSFDPELIRARLKQRAASVI
jgi:hypothetical protein